MVSAVSQIPAARPAPTASWAEFSRTLPAAPAGPEALTPAERAVAHCLREGLSNREIAARLGKSVHTVKNQVHSILAKSGSPSRMRYVTAVLA